MDQALGMGVDPLQRDYRVSATSPALLHPSGPVGAYLEAGCQGTPVQRRTWGGIKALYGRE